jgi:hypothetical protein
MSGIILTDAAGQELRDKNKTVARHTRWLRDVQPRILPHGWFEQADTGQDGYGYVRPDLGNKFEVAVFVAGQIESDGKRWLQVSAVGWKKPPTWEQVQRVKEIFCGPDALALIFLSPKVGDVAVDPNVVTLWRSLDTQATRADMASLIYGG